MSILINILNNSSYHRKSEKGKKWQIIIFGKFIEDGLLQKLQLAFSPGHTGGLISRATSAPCSRRADFYIQSGRQKTNEFELTPVGA